jgi:hypothetical protein
MRNGLWHAENLPSSPEANCFEKCLKVLEMTSSIRRRRRNDARAKRWCSFQLWNSEKCDEAAQVFETILNWCPGKAPSVLC